jgi:hypothetical protein
MREISGLKLNNQENAMSPEISNQEAIEMMNRCKQEIIGMRATIDRLKPKADAYDNLVVVLGLLPRQSVGMGEDLVWIIDKRIRELQPNPAVDS